MTLIQSGQNVIASYKVQSALGTPSSGAGGTGIRFLAGSPGMDFDRAVIENQESRRDGMSTKGRLGSRRVPLTYNKNLMVGDSNDWIQAALRGTFVAQFDLTEASGGLTSITTTTTTIVNGGGSWLTGLVEKGDMVKLTGHSTAGNNGKWMRVLGVTASTITLPTASLTLNAVADTSFTLTVAKRCIQGATPVERYFTIDEYDQDLDLSTTAEDCKVGRMEIGWQADQNASINFGLLGLDAVPYASGASPVLTSPTYSTSGPLTLVDGIIRFAGEDLDILTGLSLVLDLSPSADPTNATRVPDVTLNNARLTGSLTMRKKDLAYLTAARAETQVELFLLFSENESDPKDFAAFYCSNLTIQKASGSIGSPGPRSITVPIFGGKDEAGGDTPATMIKYITSV
jgi:hypothetical protein